MQESIRHDANKLICLILFMLIYDLEHPRNTGFRIETVLKMSDIFLYLK